jgi:hypothetical protein
VNSIWLCYAKKIGEKSWCNHTKGEEVSQISPFCQKATAITNVNYHIRTRNSTGKGYVSVQHVCPLRNVCRAMRHTVILADHNLGENADPLLTFQDVVSFFDLTATPHLWDVAYLDCVSISTCHQQALLCFSFPKHAFSLSICIIQYLKIRWQCKSRDLLLFNQLSGYDVLIHFVVLCIVVCMMSLHVMHVSNYTAVGILTVSNANLYVVFARSSSYFRVWHEGNDCLAAVLGSRFCE